MITGLLLLLTLTGYGQWENCNGPEGGLVESVIQSPSNAQELWAMSGDDPTIIVHSVNNGDNWEILSALPSNHNAYDMTITANGTIVVVGMFKSWVSTDSGKSWSDRYFKDIFMESIVPHPTNDNEVFVAGYIYSDANETHKPVFMHSTDAGITFSVKEIDVSNADAVYGISIAVSISDPSVILIGGFSQTNPVEIPFTVHSTDGGNTFVDITPEKAKRYSYGVAVHPTDSNQYLTTDHKYIYHSANAGKNWTRNTQSFNDTYAPRYSLVNNDLVFVATKNAQAHRSTDSGRSWTRVSSGLSGTRIRDIVPSRHDENLAFTGSTDGFFKSINQGSKWSSSNSGLCLTNVNTIASTAGYIFAHAYGIGIFRKQHTDRADWQKVPLECADICEFITDDSTTILAMEGTGGSIFRSADGGSVWKKVDSYYASGKDIVYAGSNTYWSCGRLSSYDLVASKSVDGGVTWSRNSLDTSANYNYVACIAAAPSNADIVYALAYGKELYRTADGGSNWTKIKISGVLGTPYDMLVDLTDPDKIVIASILGLYASNDGGTTFSRVYNGGVYRVYHSSVLGGVAICSRLNGLLVWKNFTGTPVHFGADPISKKINCMTETDDGYVYVGTNGCSVWRSNCYLSIDDDTPATDLANYASVSPNPVSENSAQLKFNLSVPGENTIIVYDLSGRIRIQKSAGYLTAGHHELQFSVEDLTPGLYFAALQGEEYSISRKFIVSR